MWQSLTPSRTRNRAGQSSARRPRLYRPRLNPLEERALLSVTLSGSEPPVPLVGSPVTWTATTSGDGPAPVYQFSVGPTGGPLHVVQDFSAADSFTWNPLQQGNYTIQVNVKDSFSATTVDSATTTYTADSRVVGNTPVVSPTANPLVALFSAPPTTGHWMSVEFKPLGSRQPWTVTAAQPIVPGTTNILVAGMLPNTKYLMRDVVDGRKPSAPLVFTTGALPTNVIFPTFKVEHAPTAGTDMAANTVLHMGITTAPNTISTVATDLRGNINWYYDSVANAFPSYATTLVPGGTVLLLGHPIDNIGGATTLREVDLAGDTVRETNINALNAELAAMGQPAITDLNHDAQRLPNGDTAVIASTVQTVDLNGTPTLYNGDMVLVLDQNFQVQWVWNAFDWLNTNRLPTLGEGPSDWLHANSVAWSPSDGNLIVSLRAQDSVVKIDYAHGTGDGHVIWTLGQGGNFTLKSSDPSPWFSHQHDVTYIGPNTIAVFDDGNTRQATNPGAQSRGQVLALNEKTMQAKLIVNANLGNYAPAVGSAQELPNGNLDFDSGFAEQTIEMRRNGKITYVLAMNMPGVQYRSFMYNNLYGTLGR